jgi:hypothetical protein
LRIIPQKPGRATVGKTFHRIEEAVLFEPANHNGKPASGDRSGRVQVGSMPNICVIPERRL